MNMNCKKVRSKTGRVWHCGRHPGPHGLKRLASCLTRAQKTKRGAKIARRVSEKALSTI